MKNSWNESLPTLATESSDVKANAKIVCNTNEMSKNIKKVLQDVKKSDTMIIVVGPEGGFSDNEINYLLENGVNYKKGIELLGDLETYNDMLSDWFKESQNKFEQLKLFKLRHDMPNYAIAVHALKSDSKYFGFTKLIELSLNHELKSKENDIEYVNNNFNELEIEYRRIMNIVNNYLNK